MTLQTQNPLMLSYSFTTDAFAVRNGIHILGHGKGPFTIDVQVVYPNARVAKFKSGEIESVEDLLKRMRNLRAALQATSNVYFTCLNKHNLTEVTE